MDRGGGSRCFVPIPPAATPTSKILLLLLLLLLLPRLPPLPTSPLTAALSLPVPQLPHSQVLSPSATSARVAGRCLSREAPGTSCGRGPAVDVRPHFHGGSESVLSHLPRLARRQTERKIADHLFPLLLPRYWEKSLHYMSMTVFPPRSGRLLPSSSLKIKQL